MYSLLKSGSPCCGVCKFFRPMKIEEETDTDISIEDFSDSIEAGVEYGRCVRNPPTFFHAGLLNAEFPVVKATVWCGEFQRNLGQ